MKRHPVHEATCERCKRRNGSIRKREKLNPRNLHAEYKRLCTPCAEVLGFRPVSFDRAQVVTWA